MADHTPPPGESLHEHIRALPKVGRVTTLDERAALAARLHTKNYHQPLDAALHTQAEQVFEKLKPQLDKIIDPVQKETHYLIHERELRAIIARSVNAGAMQTAHSVGAALNKPEVHETTSDSAGDEAVQPAV